MKIVLVQPPKPSRGVSAESHWSLTPPFSLIYLSLALKRNTPFDVKILDLEQKQYWNVSLDEVFKEHECDLYGITSTTYTRLEAIKIARHIKRTYPRAFVIVGGVHFMYCARDTLTKVTEIDAVVHGEGEKTIVDFAAAFFGDKRFENVAGLSFRDRSGTIIENPAQRLVEDIDSLSINDAGFSWEEYPEYLFSFPGQVRATSIMSSRGCPYQCIFCAKAGMKYRVRDAAVLADEIEALKERLNVEAFNFLDLTFTANPHHVERVCAELISRKLAIRWWCESRVNIPLRLLELMRAAGCVSIAIGVESGSPKVLSQISKGITVADVVSFCKRCKELGILVQPYFMYSHPGETKEEVRQTLSLISAVERYTLPAGFQPTMVFPGSKLEEIARQSGLLPREFSWCDPYESGLNQKLGQLVNVPLFMDRMSEEDLVQVFEDYTTKSIASSFAGMPFKELFSGALRLLRADPKRLWNYVTDEALLRNFIIAKVRRG